MSLLDGMKKRRTVYGISKNLPVSEETVVQKIEEITRLVPDAFNMRSQRVLIVLGRQQDRLWDGIRETFGGKLSNEKVESFKAGAGTILFFTDDAIVESMQKEFELYAENFAMWSQQSNGMLQYAVWTGLAELEIGASLQHYNPIIDSMVREMFDLPKSYRLIAEMPFGGIVEAPPEKDEEKIEERVRVSR